MQPYRKETVSDRELNTTGRALVLGKVYDRIRGHRYARQHTADTAIAFLRHIRNNKYGIQSA